MHRARNLYDRVLVIGDFIGVGGCFLTGIRGVNTQDFALQEGMGPIPDRSQERLGTTDRAIIVTRQLLLEACDRVRAGEAPRGVEPRTYRGVRAYDCVIDRDRSWREEFAGELAAKW